MPRMLDTFIQHTTLLTADSDTIKSDSYSLIIYDQLTTTKRLLIVNQQIIGDLSIIGEGPVGRLAPHYTVQGGKLLQGKTLKPR
jgi:hypothetical protein